MRATIKFDTVPEFEQRFHPLDKDFDLWAHDEARAMIGILKKNLYSVPEGLEFEIVSETGKYKFIEVSYDPERINHITYVYKMLCNVSQYWSHVWITSLGTQYFYHLTQAIGARGIRPKLEDDVSPTGITFNDIQYLT